MVTVKVAVDAEQTFSVPKGPVGYILKSLRLLVARAASETVMLRTGVQAERKRVVQVMMALQSLIKTHPSTLNELMKVCREPHYQLSRNAAKQLTDLGLLEPTGRPQASTRQIVLAAAGGDEQFPMLVDPIYGGPA